jgi:hypothetical protein
MRQMLVAIATLLLFSPTLASAQDYNVLKSDRSESFVFPYTASNQQDTSPLVYTFDEPKQPSWILLIRNNVSYVPGNQSLTVLRIQEPAPSEKYIENSAFGGE